MKARVKSICVFVLAALVITPLWVIAFPERTHVGNLALFFSIAAAINGYLWATEEGK